MLFHDLVTIVTLKSKMVAKLPLSSMFQRLLIWKQWRFMHVSHIDLYKF